MGAEQSHQEDKSSDVEQSLEEAEDEDPSEDNMLRKKLSELEVEANHFREKFKVLDTRIGVLKYEHTYLRGQVVVLKGKVESLENTNEVLETEIEILKNSDFEKRIKSLESQIKSDHPPVPPFHQTKPVSVVWSSAKVQKGLQKYIPKGFEKKEKKTKEPCASKSSFQDKKVVTSGKSTKLPTLQHYDRPLPPYLVKLFQVSRCVLCEINLQSKIIANEHYWGKKHFEVLEEYLDNSYKQTPQLKPKYKPSTTYNRPLPQAIISQCTTKKCGLCNKTFTDHCNSLQEHYYGSQHGERVNKFLKNNPQLWQEGILNNSYRSVPQIITCPQSKKEPKSTPDPSSCLPNLAQSVMMSQFKQEAIARDHNHNKGIRYVSELLIPEDTEELNFSEDFLYNDEEVILSDNTKDVITVSEICNEHVGLNAVFIGCDMIDKDGEMLVQGVTIINHEGRVILYELVPTANECEEKVTTQPAGETKVTDFLKFQLRIKELLEATILVGYDLGHKLKALKLDHPEQLSIDIKYNFAELVPGVKPSLKLFVKKCLDISEYQHSSSNEAQVSWEIYNTVGGIGERFEEKKYQGIECRILMPKSAIAAIENKGRKILKEVKDVDVHLRVPFVGGVVSIFAENVVSLSKTLYDLLRLVDYVQLVKSLKLIVPSKLILKKKDFVTNNEVRMYGKRLPKSKEKVIGFCGGVSDMVSGVSQCLLLMEENDCGYGGPGSRYDYSDHDGLTAALYGGWDDTNENIPVEDDAKCSSCHIVGVDNFSLNQLRMGGARRCYSCVCL